MNADARSLRRLDVELEERAELLSAAARELPGLSPGQREDLRTRVLAFLRHEIGGHLLSEEHVLYPKIVARLGDPLAAAPLHYAHAAIRWWTDEIAGADIADVDELQRLLYGVHALVKVHLSREEELYAGALDSASWPV